MQKKGSNALGNVNFNDLCIHPGLKFLPKFRCPDFKKYDRNGCPKLISSCLVGLLNTMMMINCWFKHSQEVSLEQPCHCLPRSKCQKPNSGQSWPDYSSKSTNLIRKLRMTKKSAIRKARNQAKGLGSIPKDGVMRLLRSSPRSQKEHVTIFLARLPLLI